MPLPSSLTKLRWFALLLPALALSSSLQVACGSDSAYGTRSDPTIVGPTDTYGYGYGYGDAYGYGSNYGYGSGYGYGYGYGP